MTGNGKQHPTVVRFCGINHGGGSPFSDLLWIGIRAIRWIDLITKISHRAQQVEGIAFPSGTHPVGVPAKHFIFAIQLSFCFVFNVINVLNRVPGDIGGRKFIGTFRVDAAIGGVVLGFRLVVVFLRWVKSCRIGGSKVLAVGCWSDRVDI